MFTPLGAVLYECLTGRPPFQGVHLADTLDQVRHRDPLPPRRLQPGVPRDLETICLKCLQKDPVRRYRTAHDLGQDLRRFREGRPILARPTAAWEHAFKWAKRNPASAALVGVSVVAAFALLAVSLAFNAALVQQRDKAERDHALALMTSGSLARLARYADIEPTAESIASLREAITVFERLTAEYPDEPDYHDQLGQLYYIRNKQDETQETFDKALAAIRRALDLWEERLRERPRDPAARSALARGLHNLGDLFAARGKGEEAEPAIVRALQLRGDLAAENGPDSPYAVELALTQVLMGRFHFCLRTALDGALGWSNRAIPVLERDLAATQPNPMSRSRLTDAHGICAMALGHKGHLKEALAHWDAALTDATMIGRLRFLFQGSRAYVLAELGRHAEAAREANELTRSPSATGGNLLYPADAFARSAVAVKRDQTLTASEQDRLAGEYGGRAVALLKQAAEQGAFANAAEIQALRTSPDYAALLDRADFQDFLSSPVKPIP